MIGLQKVSDRNDEHRVQVWIDGRMGRESKFYFDSSVDGFALLGDGQDIARVERMQKAEGALTEPRKRCCARGIRHRVTPNHLGVSLSTHWRQVSVT